MIYCVIWVVLMMFWLFGGGYFAYQAPNGPVVFGAGTLVPWLCVLILGLVIFGAVAVGPIR